MFAPCPSCGLVDRQASPIWIMPRSAGTFSVRWRYRAKVNRSGASICSSSAPVLGHSASTLPSRPRAHRAATPRADPRGATRRTRLARQRNLRRDRSASRRPSCAPPHSAAPARRRRSRLGRSNPSSPRARHRARFALLEGSAASRRPAHRRRDRTGRPPLRRRMRAGDDRPPARRRQRCGWSR